MPKFTIEHEVTERTVQRVEIEADTPEEALRLVEEYEFNNSESWEVSSIEWSLQNAKVVTP